MSKIVKIDSCVDCPFHSVLPDPDPNDWFNRDDVRVFCTRKSKNATVACRPYQTRKETTPPPKWCPLEDE